MSVEIWFRDSFDTEVVDGDLQTLTHHLNVAAANGKQFTILEDAATSEGVMVETRNIIKARERNNDAFVGS